MMNRITAAIAHKTAEIAHRIATGLTTAERVEATRLDLDMEFDEYIRFQELKSRAALTGLLTPAEAQTVYALLGETPATFNRRDVASKAVLTGLFRELLARRLRSA